MNRIERMTRWGAGLAVGALLLATPATFVRAGEQDTTISGNPAPSGEQIRSLFTRVVENQHRNDRAMEEFERIEHVVTRKSSDTSDGFTERTERILPSGTGTMKLLMVENGSQVSPEAYRHQLQIAVTALNIAVHPNDRYRQDLVKFEKRRRERAEVVDTSLQAFRATWAGRETRGSRTYAKYILEPNPEYKASTRLATTFEHVRAAIWVDESQAQFARIEGDITSDITFGGGHCRKGLPWRPLRHGADRGGTGSVAANAVYLRRRRAEIYVRFWRPRTDGYKPLPPRGPAIAIHRNRPQ